MEYLIARFYAPCIISNMGRLCILALWFTLILIASNGIRLLKSDFSMEFFIPKGSMTQRYVDLYNEHFDFGFEARIFIENEEIDFSSEEVQYAILELDSRLESCFMCQERWFLPNSHDNGYLDFRKWVKKGNCSHLEKFTSPFQKVVP